MIATDQLIQGLPVINWRVNSLLIGVCVASAVLSQHSFAAQGIEVIRQEEGFLFQEGASKILFYQLKPRLQEGKYERANYVHPLYDLRGNVLTEDFPADHPHQRGIFWAWHQLTVEGKQVADSWALENWQWEAGEATLLPSERNAAGIQTTGNWKSPLVRDPQGRPTPLVKETTSIRAFRIEQGLRKIDFDIRLQALQPDVRLGGSTDEKGYGGFSLRVRLPEDVKFIGQNGSISPKLAAVETGPWLNVVGSFTPGIAASGIAVLGHPSDPGFPQPWILRNQKSMQNSVYPGREPVTISTAQPLVLRYRIILHDGSLAPGNLDRLQCEFASSP